MAQKIESYNSSLQILLNQRIRTIHYCEIDYGDDQPNYEHGDFHDMDHGIQFEMENGSAFFMMWAAQYQQHDLKFGKGSIVDQFPKDYPPPLRWMNHHAKWTDFIGNKIVKVSSVWPFVKYENSSAEVRYPQDILLEFENGESLVISALEIDEDGSVVSMANHVTVFFDVEVARKYEIFAKLK